MIIREVERNKLFVSDFLTCIAFPVTKLRRKITVQMPSAITNERLLSQLHYDRNTKSTESGGADAFPYRSKLDDKLRMDNIHALPASTQ